MTGKILEDKVIKKVENVKDISKKHTFKNITKLNKVRLGIRNTFNIIPKFLLVFAVYLFITSALLSEYASFKKEEHIASTQGYNWVFSDLSTNRIIIKKENGDPFTEEDYKRIEGIEKVRNIKKNDLLVDGQISLSNEYLYIDGIATEISDFNSNLDLGRMPENDYEIIVEGSKDMYYMSNELLDVEMSRIDFNTGNEEEGERKLKVVGIKYTDDEKSIFDMGRAKIYVSNIVLKEIEKEINKRYSTVKMLFNNKYYNYQIVPNSKVPVGKAYVNTDFEDFLEGKSPIGKNIEISVENIYYKDNLTVAIEKIYKKSNIEKLLGLKDYDSNIGNIFINTDDYNKLFNKDIYQSSVFVEDSRDVEEVANKLKEMGIKPLTVKDTLVNEDLAQIFKIFKTIVTVVVVIALIFVSYFVIKIILKSRNVYFSTIRMLGASSKICKNLLVIELFTVSNLAFFFFIGLIILARNGVFNSDFISNLITYLRLNDYIILYIILVFMSYITSLQFAKSLFKKSAMNAYKEEV